MALSSSSKENISLKKLVGKSHTSNSLEAFNESKTTGLTISTSSIFAGTISTSPTSTDLYDITSSTVEYVRLVATALPESLSNGKFHAFKLSLPSDYESSSSNTKAGTLTFLNSQDLHSTVGKVQLVPTSFSDSYEGKAYYGGNTTKASGTRIPLLDSRSWYLDCFNGILFQETPPTDAGENPSHVEAFIYIGDMADTAITSNDLSTSSIGDLSDVDITTASPANDQVLKWDGTKFIPSSSGTAFTADTSSMWEADANDANNIYPHGIIDGTIDTGMFAINLSAGELDYTSPNVTLYDVLEELSSMNAYTPSTKEQADITDAFFEFDTNGDIMPKENS
jgi:hypothetical protein